MIIDTQTIEAFAQGSHEAFGQLFRAFYPKVRAFVRGFVKDPDDAEDVVQTVFIKLWDKRQYFLQVRNVDAYFYQLTRNTTLNYISAKQIIPVIEEIEEKEIEDRHSPLEALEAKEMQLLIEMVVENLPPQRQCVFRLSRIEGLSNDEIAKQLGIQKKTVENHLNLALKELRKALLLSLIMLNVWEIW